MTAYLNIVKNLIYKTRLFKFRRFLDKAYIIAYHKVSNNPCTFYPEISYNLFKKHIYHLISYYKIISIDELVHRLNNNKPLNKCVVLTFDDGFRDNYDVAFRLLKSNKIPATIYLITSCINGQIPPWFIKFRYMFMVTERKKLNLSIQQTKFEFSLSTFADKKYTSDCLMDYLRKINDEERIKLLNMLKHELKVYNFDPLEDMMLTWEQIKEMKKNNITFGAHTSNHPILSQVSDQIFEKEAEISKKEIENQIQEEVTTFAYPFGHNSDCPIGSEHVLKKLGFTSAVTTEPEAVKKKSAVYHLSRTMPSEMFLIKY